MSRHKYTINMLYRDGEVNFNIGPEHIAGLVIEYAYNSEVLQPLIMAKVNLDKNFIDRMIKYKADARIQLVIKKVDISINANGAEENYINTTCTYELMDDLYNEKTILYEKNDQRQDVFAQTTLGLSSETIVNRNCKANDCILKGGNMLGVVWHFTSHMPMIIEPFDNNHSFDKELIIPPTETVKQMMAFLNNVKTFYNTPYRLYFDFNCTYLLSTKGIGVQSEDEEYKRVTIKVVEPKEDGYEGFEQGISRDSENETYQITVMSKHSHFYRDNTVDKQFNQLIGVVDPSRQKSTGGGGMFGGISDALSGLSEGMSNISSALDAASGVVDAVNNQVGPIMDNINDVMGGKNTLNFNCSEIMGTMGDFNSNITSALGSADSTINNYIGKLEASNATAGGRVGGLFYTESYGYKKYKEQKEAQEAAIMKDVETTGLYHFINNPALLRSMNKGMTNTMQTASNENEEAVPDLEAGQGTFNDLAKNSTRVGYNITSITGSIKGVKIPDIHANIAGMVKKCNQNNDDADSCTNMADSSQESMNLSAVAMNDACNKATTALSNKIQMIKDIAQQLIANDQSTTTVNSDGTSSTGANVEAIKAQLRMDLEPLETFLESMKEQAQYISDCFGKIESCTQRGIELAQKFKLIQEDITPHVNSLYDVKDMLKSETDPLKSVADLLEDAEANSEQLEYYKELDSKSIEIIVAYISKQNEGYSLMMDAHDQERNELLERYYPEQQPIEDEKTRRVDSVQIWYDDVMKNLNDERERVLKEIDSRYIPEREEFESLISDRTQMITAAYELEYENAELEEQQAIQYVKNEYIPAFNELQTVLDQEMDQYLAMCVEDYNSFVFWQQHEYQIFVNSVNEREQTLNNFYQESNRMASEYDEETRKILKDLETMYLEDVFNLDQEFKQNKADYFVNKIVDKANFDKFQDEEYDSFEESMWDEEDAIYNDCEDQKNYLYDQVDIVFDALDEVHRARLEETEEEAIEEAENLLQESLANLYRLIYPEEEDWDVLMEDAKSKLDEFDFNIQYSYTGFRIYLNQETNKYCSSVEENRNIKLFELEKDQRIRWEEFKQKQEEDLKNFTDQQDQQYTDLVTTYEETREQKRLDYDDEYVYLVDERNSTREEKVKEREAELEELNRSWEIDRIQKEEMDTFMQEQEANLEDFKQYQAEFVTELTNTMNEDIKNVEEYYNTLKADILERKEIDLSAIGEMSRIYMEDYYNRYNSETNEVQRVYEERATMYKESYDNSMNEIDRLYKQYMDPILERKAAEAEQLHTRQVNETVQYLAQCRESLFNDYKSLTMYLPEYIQQANELVESHNANLVQRYENELSKEAVFVIQRFGLFGGGDLSKSIGGSLGDLGLTSGNLGDFLSNATSFGDLSSIGSLGLTSIMSGGINFGGKGSKGGRVKYVKLSNDDPNKLKSVEFESIIRSNTFNVIKEYMDNSIITPNKEYYVEHVSELSEENGRYLLNHKIETYIREDHLYNCQTGIELARVPQ